MGTHAGRIHEDLCGPCTAVLLPVVPEPLPEVTSFPATETIIDGIPVAKVIGEVLPGDAGTRLLEPSCNEPPVAELRRTAGVMLKRTQNGCSFSPNGISDHKT